MVVISLVLHPAIKISLVEKRMHDAWLDFSRREIREGQVNYYKAKDPVSGEWMFKVCRDFGVEKLIVKAVKCPSGRVYSQLEGDTMVFQRSNSKGYFYDIISLTYRDESGRIRRRMIDEKERIPSAINEFFRVERHKIATGKHTPFAEHFVTLTRDDDFRGPTILFLIERAWPLSSIPPEQAIEMANERQRLNPSVSHGRPNVLSIIRSLEKASLDEVRSKLESVLRLNTDEVAVVIDGLLREGTLRKISPNHMKVIRLRRIDHRPSFTSTVSGSKVPLALIAASST